jgi:hypothetical protein
MKLKLLSFLLLFSVNINYALNTFKISNNYSVIFNSPITTATLTTTVSSTYTSAQLGGNITSDGGATVTERGVVYSLTTNPTTANTKVVIGSGTGAFSQAVTGLTTSTTYHVRAYAINSQGTSYGSELSFTTAAFCGGNIIGSGYGTNPISAMALDNNWKIVTLPQGYSYSETLPYNAYVPKTSSLAPVYLDVNGYTVSGSTYYWIAPKSDASALIGGGANYNWIVQQTFNVAQSGFYDLNFSGMGDNAISFYINGVIDTTDPVKPTITGGTQIGTRFDSFTSMGTFSGVTYLNAGVNIASMVMEDWGGATTALISGSTFTCNTSYINVNPTISSISDISIVEGATPSPIAFTINDQETPLNNLTVTASSSNTALIPNSNITLQGNTGSRTLSLTPVSGELGTSTITITLDDNSGGIVTKTFVVTMNPLVLNKYGKLVPDVLQAINIHGAEGVGSGQNKFGKSVDKPLHKIGDSYQGGIIFYTYVDNSTGIMHGLIAAVSDQSTSSSWGCDGVLIGSTSSAVGSGQANTTAILNGCSDSSIAARVCDSYSVTVNGITYNDWYLPSFDELSLMYSYKLIIGGFANAYYWSSSESDISTACRKFFQYGNRYCNLPKTDALNIRAIRSF